MKRSAVIVAALGAAALFQIACDQDPAKAVRIPRASATGAARSANAASESSGAPAAGSARPGLQWNASVCPPPSEAAGGPSTLVGTGACAFQHQGAASCTLTDDDLLMSATRPMANDGLFMVYLSVENFHQGGENTNVEIVVGVQNSQGLYRWATDRAHVGVAADLRSVNIFETHLSALPPLKEPDVVVSGTFKCTPETDTSPAIH